MIQWSSCSILGDGGQQWTRWYNRLVPDVHRRLEGSEVLSSSHELKLQKIKWKHWPSPQGQVGSGSPGHRQQHSIAFATFSKYALVNFHSTAVETVFYKWWGFPQSENGLGPIGRHSLSWVQEGGQRENCTEVGCKPGDQHCWKEEHLSPGQSQVEADQLKGWLRRDHSENTAD